MRFGLIHALQRNDPISIFDESFLRTEEDFVNTYSKSYVSYYTVEEPNFSEEFVRIYLIHT